MTSFLAVAAMMVALALAPVLPALMRHARRGDAPAQAAVNAAIHASELASLDQELASGAITRESHASARDEILRRMLAEDAQAPTPVERAGRWPAFVVAVAVPLVAALMYWLVGNPAALHEATEIDRGALGTRLSASATRKKLESHLRHAPRDGRAWVLLARLDTDAARYEDAARAYERALAVAIRIARDPEIWCELADALGMAQGGTLSGRPRELVEKALALKPDHPRALEMAGSAAYEAGDYAVALDYWSALLAQLSPDSLEYAELQAAVAQVRERLPASAPGR